MRFVPRLYPGHRWYLTCRGHALLVYDELRCRLPAGVQGANDEWPAVWSLGNLSGCPGSRPELRRAVIMGKHQVTIVGPVLWHGCGTLGPFLIAAVVLADGDDASAQPACGGPSPQCGSPRAWVRRTWFSDSAGAR